MLEAQTHDRNANVPTAPANDAVTIVPEQYVALDQTSPRPCKRRCLYPHLSPSLTHATTEINLASEAKAKAGVEAEAEAKSEAAAAQVPYPLTADNLATLPDHSAQSHPSPTSTLTSTASTFDSSQRLDHVGTDTSVEMTVSETRSLLNRNRLHLFDNDAEERARKIIHAGNEIRERRRSSAMSSPIAETLVQTIKKYANKGERTFMFHLWKALLNDTRQVPDRELTLQDDPDLFQWVGKAWDKDYIWGKWEADFAPDTCPTLEKTGDAKVDAVLSGVPRITTPRPDIAYGFEVDAFDEAYREILHRTTGGKITGQQFGTFFAVEAKCGERSIEEAENQCCRTGATMAKSRRDLARALVNQKTLLQNLRASTIVTPLQSTDLVAPTSSHVTPVQAPSSNPSVEQPPTASNDPTQDMDTISFTLAVLPQIAKLSIHFAETWPDGHTEWQMHRLKSYLLEECDYLQELHHDIDNILDWGCTTRKKQITNQAAELAQIALDMEEAKKAKSTTEAACSKASGTGSKRKR